MLSVERVHYIVPIYNSLGMVVSEVYTEDTLTDEELFDIENSWEDAGFPKQDVAITVVCPIKGEYRVSLSAFQETIENGRH